MPMGKVDPLASPPVCVSTSPGQLSECEGAVYVTTAPDKLVGLATIPDGRVICGFSLSFTVTVNEHVAVPHEFVAVAVTAVVPFGNEYGEETAVLLIS